MSEMGAPSAPFHDIRCECGQLVARWHRDTIVIKCKRCRRFVSIPLDEIHGAPPPFDTR